MLPENTIKNTQSYHHGNVKEALIDAALKLIENNQLEVLSLRRLAKEVGVTPSAVYNHFADKESLMLAIKIRLYEEINLFFDARSSGAKDPEQALLEICFAYFHFSQQQPARFQFLFSSTLPTEQSTPEFIKVSCHSVVKARALVYKIFQKYQVPCAEADVVNTTLLIWSQLHGMVALRNSGSIPTAVAYQDWPASCALSRNEEVEMLIRNQVKGTVGAILNKQHAESHH